MKLTFISFLIFLSLLAASQDFEVAPVLVSFNAEPGSIQSTKLSVKNYANTKQKFELTLSDYSVDETGNKLSMAAGSSLNSLASWITINPAFVELNPNESRELDVMITVPKGHTETRWGMIHVQVAKEQSPLDMDQDMATGVVLVPRIVVLVKQSPKSNNNYSAKIHDLKEISEPKDEFRKFEAIITNTGEKVIDAEVSLSLANMETAKEEHFKEKKISVYPKQSRAIVLTLPKQINKGKYALAAIMDYGHRKSLEGVQLMIVQD
jgi:hypothetical protein